MIAELVDAAVEQVRALPVKRAAPMRAGRVALSRRLKSAEPVEIIEAAMRLKAKGLDWFGWELIYAHPPTLKSIDRRTIEALGQGMASWPETDGFGMVLAGPAWLNGRLSDRDIGRWARSDDPGGVVPRWLRRPASITNRVGDTVTRSAR